MTPKRNSPTNSNAKALYVDPQHVVAMLQTSPETYMMILANGPDTMQAQIDGESARRVMDAVDEHNDMTRKMFGLGIEDDDD